MYQTVKGLIKLYSIVLLSILIFISFLKCKGNFKEQLFTGLETGLLMPVIIYLFNI